MPDDPVGGEAGAECEEGEPHTQARLRHIFQQEVIPVQEEPRCLCISGCLYSGTLAVYLVIPSVGDPEIRMFLGLLDPVPDPLVRGMDPDHLLFS